MLNILCSLLNSVVCGSEKQNGCMGTEWFLSVSVVYYLDHIVAWELRLSMLPSITESMDHVSLVWEKITIQNLKYNFYLMCIAFEPL